MSLLVAILIATSGPALSPEQQVRERFQSYMAAWERNDRKAVWSMMSRSMKRGNDDSEASFENDTETPDVRVAGHCIRSIRIAGERATIEADVKFSNPPGTERERFEFVREDGGWYFDAYRPVNPKTD